jgi:DMSO/TMAO reductase YedYZ molybdopterin-dependent catalytic subunit
MQNQPTLKISGEVTTPTEFRFEDLAAMPDQYQIKDVSRIDQSRKGDAVTLEGLLQAVGSKSSAKYLGLHSKSDDFHASIPLEPVRQKAFVIYRLNGGPLTEKQGGPFRFYIPDYAACHTHEIDECANVKFVDHMELTAAAGFDNRPHDGQEHDELHRRQAENLNESN